jgi:PAS domain S-box-containing protein
MAHRLFIVSYFILPVAALFLGQSWPVGRVLPLVGGAVLLFYALHRHELLRGLRRRGGLNPANSIWPYQELVDVVCQLSEEADEERSTSIEQQARLLGLGEIWPSLTHAEGWDTFFDGIAAYLGDQGGYREVALLRVDAMSGELAGSWATPMTAGQHIRKVRWGLGGVGGAIGDTLRDPENFSRRADRNPQLLLINGERPDFMLQSDGFIVQPLVTPLPKPECFEHRHLHRPNCPAFESVPHRASAGSGKSDSMRGQCLSCRHYPLHGVLVVTDAERGEPISEHDRHEVSTVSQTVAAVLDHARHYREGAEAEEFRDQIFDSMNNGLITTDTRGRVVFANRRAHEMAGLGPEMMGRPIEEFVEILTSPHALRAALYDGMEAIHLDGYIHARDARDARSRIPIRLNLGPYRIGPAGRRGAVCLFSDHSGVKAMEEEIRHLDTLAAVGRFASSMAHEIRNPLGGISAGIHYMGRHKDFPDELQQNVGVIEGEIQRLDGIIKNLLEVARPVEMQLSRCEPPAILSRAVRAMAAWLEEKGIEVVVECPSTLPQAYLDGEKIQQVLINMIKNAGEASAAGSQIRVSCRPIQSADEGHDFTLSEAGGIYLSVEDSGEGIHPEDVPQLFEPFFTRKSTGTGLGLYVCHNFIQRHGGVIRAESAPGIGTRMSILLPNAPVSLGGKHEAAHSARR